MQSYRLSYTALHCELNSRYTVHAVHVPEEVLLQRLGMFYGFMYAWAKHGMQPGTVQC